MLKRFCFALLLILLTNFSVLAQSCRNTGGLPFVEGGCIHMPDLNAALSGHPGNIPPVNVQGEGAPYGYHWLDLSTVPATLRICNKSTNCSATYTPSEWAIEGTLDAILGWIPNVANQGAEATLASGPIVDLNSVPNTNVTVSGITNIGSFGSSGATGSLKIVTFTGNLTVIYNATSLILPGQNNIIVQPGDVAFAKYLGAGNWKVLWFTRLASTIAEGTLASAATVDINSIINTNITITGSTTIASLGASGVAGTIKVLTFTGSPILTYNATSLIIPGQASVFIQPGDVAWAKYLGAGNWKILWFTRLIGTPLAALEPETTITGTGAQAVTTTVIRWIPTTPANVTFTLPAVPVDSERHTFIYGLLTPIGTYFMTIQANTGQTIREANGTNTTYIMSNPIESTTFRYYASSAEWVPE